jgi:pectate lyase
MKNRLLLLSFILTLSLLQATAGNFSLLQESGWIEALWVKWAPYDGADSYRVYYSGEGATNRVIDDPLIRSYGSFFRADIPGLKPGTYTVKIAAVVAGEEVAVLTTNPLIVKGHDRTGFAFSKQREPGAYKADGTPKDNAVVVYVTEKTKNTVSLNVTGASENPCVGLQTILDGYKKGKDLRPLIIRMIGQIGDLTYMLNGDIVVENNKNANSFITIEGIGNDAVADGWGIRIKNGANIEVRNLAIMNCDSDEGDNIGLQQNNEHVWVHHCDFFYGNPGGDADQAKGDGALDCKLSAYVTFSYNHFWDTGKSNLLGLSETPGADWYITYHHNWFDHSDSRHPRVRVYSAHVYNNYYDGISKYGVGATEGSSVFVEGNYFRNCKYPMLISMQGSDVFNTSTGANDYKDMPTFSKEDGGIIKAFNNYMEGASRFVPHGAEGFPNTSIDFDAFVVSSRNELVPVTVTAFQGGAAYNNFDANALVMYACTPDSPEDAKGKVVASAGRLEGGDFKWSFDNSVDDNAYAVNAELKTALTSYKTSLVAVQGEDSINGGSVPEPDPGSGEVNSSDMVHNFTLSDNNSTFYTIKGNLATNKGTVVFEGLALTQCLKMESATEISFTLTSPGTLKLVFNDGFSGKVKVNGIPYNAVAGVLILELPAGVHKVTKGDIANLYYIDVSVPSGVDDFFSTQPLIYPNPVSTKLTVASEVAIHWVGIYTLGGILLNQFEGNTQSIDVSLLEPGIYLLVVRTEQGVSNYKIQKQ